jgi:prepilin-type processing-associated H-X9-DG protein
LGVRQRGASWWDDAPSYGIAQARLPLLLCPSASRAQTGAIFLIHYSYRNPGSVKVSVLGRDAPGDERLGATDYLGCGGLWGTTGTRLDHYRGVFGDRSTTRLKHVVDGASATLLLGETLGARDSDEGDFLHAWIGGGPLSTFNGLGDRPFQFTSAHPTTVNFAFADGAVRALAKNIDKQALQALGGIADGDLTPLREGDP